ncbi:Alpha/beta hydrolase fold-1 [Mycena amicta]|nr:Alpha/beta hydrolase fold-1 [Mycena amicta]
MQRSTVHSVRPSPLCPFHVEAIQYHLPERTHRNAGGLTLVFLHATNTHKESYEPVLRHLLGLDLPSPLRVPVRDVWCIENPNHGSSAIRNRALLETPAYRDTWTAEEYTRAAYAFLASTEHGVDFRSRSLVGLAHSAASAPLLLLQQRNIPFVGLIFMDAAILPINTRATKVLCTLFGNWAKSKPHTWPSRAEAKRNLAETAFRVWDPLAVDLFVKHAIRPVDDDDNDGSGSNSAVTLNCSTRQEAAYYLSPSADLVDAPTEIFVQLAKEDRLPIHTIICLNDEYKGKGTEMKQFQIDHVRRMRNGSVQIIEGGHMFPQINPKGTARAIEQALERIRAHALNTASSAVVSRL